MIKSASYGIIFILIDQISKWFILEQLDLDIIGSYDVYSPFLTLKMGWNTGINFGLFSESYFFMRWILIAISLGICLFLLFFFSSNQINTTLYGYLINTKVHNI